MKGSEKTMAKERRLNASGDAPSGVSEKGGAHQSGKAAPSDGWVDPRVICFHEVRNEAVDYYQHFRAAIITSGPAHQKVLMFASALPGEGRSTTVANLAVVTARDLGSRLVIVDCDLRTPSTHELFRVASEPGLSDVLAGKATLESTLVPLPIPGVHFLPGGTPIVNAAELLSSARTDEVLAALRERYDYVLLDAPAILPVLDASRLAPKADGVVLVVRAWQTPRARVLRALEMLEGARVLGFFLNGGEPTLR